MATLLRDHPKPTAPGTLVVTVSRGGVCAPIADAAQIRVQAPKGLQNGLETRITRAVAAALAWSPVVPRSVRLRTQKRASEIDVAGAIVIVPVLAANLRRLPAIVRIVAERGAVAAQLVWDGHAPDRASAEPILFRIMEDWRARRSTMPVVIAPCFAATEALLHLLPRGRR